MGLQKDPDRYFVWDLLQLYENNPVLSSDRPPYRDQRMPTSDVTIGARGAGNSWAFCTEHAPNLARNRWGEGVKFNMAAYE